jgi:hypothetical protein
MKTQLTIRDLFWLVRAVGWWVERARLQGELAVKAQENKYYQEVVEFWQGMPGRHGKRAPKK